ncbi:MAG: hypothetical protein FWD83_10560, partial [Promicromonosporaceae bacterium]|nr:hypothetical protein [Promicromonosporaceae bacterium]
MNNCRLTPRAFATITRIETKVWLRDPVAAGMCLVFPVGYILLITAMNEELSADYMVAPVLGIAM